tara:strand:+ start:1218 stop:1445 length:228 start_codon:yes stop_codon:yes gene_type:complete
MTLKMEISYKNKNIAKDLAKLTRDLQIQAMKLAKKREREAKKAARAGKKYTELVSNVAGNKKRPKSLITYDSGRA